MNDETRQTGHRHRPQGTALVVGLVVTASLCLVARTLGQTPAVPSDADCLRCHRQNRLAELLPDDRRLMVAPGEGYDATSAPETRPGLLILPEPLVSSVHRRLACVDCHTDATALPHRQPLGRPDCTSCHDAARTAYNRGPHAMAAAQGDPQAPDCSTCHGGHDVLPSSDRASHTHPFNAVRMCADCHRHHAVPGRDESTAPALIDAYLDSVHGQAVSRAGLLFAATCSDCHGHHEVLPASDPEAPTSRVRIPQTCGACHLGVIETYRDSIHGRLLAEGDERGPVCTDCHTAHAITHASLPEYSRDIIAECGECHDRAPEGARARRASFYDTYRLSYHGQVTKLGSTRAARCSDCHGAHDILPISDPASRLHPDNRLESCRSCHPDANASFAAFDPHADYRDAERYPLLHAVWLYFIVVMSGAFGFFGLHSVLWFVRSVIERFRNGPAPRFSANPHAIRRFTLLNRVNHALAIVSFFGLTLTGIPLFFSDRPWAHGLAESFGGVDAAGIWHRVFAVMLIMNFVLHLVGLVHTFRRRNGVPVRKFFFGPHTLFPTWKDVKDCAGMIRWFFVGGRKPAFGRWTYWEKFDYWAEIVGSLIIGGSGLLLWFPTFFSKFLPGASFNVAAIVHGYEALLAIGFIFTIHFFNAHLRLEKFPVDDVIFTGVVPEEELAHERPAEYKLLVERQKLESLRTEPAPRWARPFAILLGIVAMTVGGGLVALIILAGLEVF